MRVVILGAGCAGLAAALCGALAKAAIVVDDDRPDRKSALVQRYLTEEGLQLDNWDAIPRCNRWGPLWGETLDGELIAQAMRKRFISLTTTALPRQARVVPHRNHKAVVWTGRSVNDRWVQLPSIILLT